MKQLVLGLLEAVKTDNIMLYVVNLNFYFPSISSMNFSENARQYYHFSSVHTHEKKLPPK